MYVWRYDLGPGWEAFKRLHPRDYHGKGDSTKGNAGEIYFLSFLYYLDRTGNALEALESAVERMLSIPGADSFQLNAVAQCDSGMWAVRFANSEAQLYPVYYGLTCDGYHWVADHLPPEASDWHEMPEHSIVSFPLQGDPTVHLLEPSDSSNPGGGTSVLMLRVQRVCPAAGIDVFCRLPVAGCLEILDLQGRRRALARLGPGAHGLLMELPLDAGSGVFWIRLRSGENSVEQRFVSVR